MSSNPRSLERFRRPGAASLSAWFLPLVFGVGCGADPSSQTLNANTQEPLVCPSTIDPTRSLGIADLPVLEATNKGVARFSLERVLSQIAKTGQLKPKLTASDVYQRLFDSNNNKAGGKIADGQHCDDEQDGRGQATLNGFPLQCPRQEGALADLSLHNPFCSGPNCDPYTPIAITNRFDLAPPDGSNCGQYRIVFGKGPNATPLALAATVPGVNGAPATSGVPGTNRNLIIFEAILPNPEPDCGVAACAPVVEYWAKLTSVNDPAVRAQLLDDFFFKGVHGFGPAVHWNNYTGHVNPDTKVQESGQIRANQFMNTVNGVINGQQWELREYNLRKTCTGNDDKCTGQARLVTVKSNPSSSLFDDNNTSPIAQSFRDPTNPAGLIAQLSSLTVGNVNQISLGGLDPIFNVGQSTEQLGPLPINPLNQDSNYTPNFNPSGAFSAALQTALTTAGSTLTPGQIVRRVETQACAGCHELSTSAALKFGGVADANMLGGGLIWPDTNTFTQTSEKVLAPLAGSLVACDTTCTASPTTCQCAWILSPALNNVFLPARASNMLTFLTNNGCGSGRCGDKDERITETKGDHGE